MAKRADNSEKIRELKGKLADTLQRLDKEKLRTAKYGCFGMLAILVIIIILVAFGICPGKIP